MMCFRRCFLCCCDVFEMGVPLNTQLGTIPCRPDGCDVAMRCLLCGFLSVDVLVGTILCYVGVC